SAPGLPALDCTALPRSPCDSRSLLPLGLVAGPQWHPLPHTPPSSPRHPYATPTPAQALHSDLAPPSVPSPGAAPPLRSCAPLSIRLAVAPPAWATPSHWPPQNYSAPRRYKPLLPPPDSPPALSSLTPRPRDRHPAPK